MGDFDRHAATYGGTVGQSMGLLAGSHDFLVSLKARSLLDLVQRRIGEPEQARVLDVGCGVGLIDQALAGQFRSLYGVDVSENSVQHARQSCAGATFIQFDGLRLPFPDASFELVFAVCVLHHVRTSQWQTFTKEMARVVAAGGLAVIVEHNPFNPATRLVVNRCEFDRDAVLLSAGKCRTLFETAGLDVVEQRFIAFLPFAIPGTQLLERAVSWLPLGAQYYVAAGGR